jgi:hypothetical protein
MTDRTPRGYGPEGEPWFDDDATTGPRWAGWNFESQKWDALPPGCDPTEVRTPTTCKSCGHEAAAHVCAYAYNSDLRETCCCDKLAEARAPLDAAYRERNAVVAALIRSHGWPAEVVMAPDTEGWWIVYAETPQGQVSWHIGPDDMDLFSEWPVAFGTARSPWDGHSTEEKYRRLAALRAALEEPTP